MEDPLGLGGGDLTLYSYAGNNPVVFVDPSGLCAVSGGTNGGYYGSLLADPNLASAIKSQHLKEKANAMMSLEMGALGTIGAATGAYYLGPSIVAGAKASWPYVVAGGTAAYKFGEASAYKAIDFYSRFSVTVR